MPLLYLQDPLGAPLPSLGCCPLQEGGGLRSVFHMKEFMDPCCVKGRSAYFPHREQGRALCLSG